MTEADITGLLGKAVEDFADGKTAIVYFSLTGNTEKLAKLLQKILQADCYRITSLNLPKFLWLIFSLLPILWKIFNCPIRVEPALELNKYENIALGFPKWGFGCPPLLSFLKKNELSGKRVIPFMSYGGWDYERFYSRVCESIEKRGAAIAAKILIKRTRLS